MPRPPRPTRAASQLTFLVLASGACTTAEERPRTEYLEGGITIVERDDGDGEVSSDAGPDAAGRVSPDAAGRVSPDAAANVGPDAAAQADHGVAYQSGSRLRAMIVRIEGSAVRLAGWFDRTLDAPCTFVPDGVAGTSCLPTSSANRYYSDASCSKPVWARSRPSCPTTQRLFASETTADSCSGGTLIAVRRLTASTLDPATPLFQRIGESCSALTFLPNPELFDASEPLPWSEFVNVTKRERLGGVPDHELLITSDGASVPGDKFDKQGAQCEFVTLDGQSYCVPRPYYFLPEGQSGAYADSICTNAKLTVVSSCQGSAPATPTFLLQPDRCSVTLFRPSAAQEALYTLATDKTCKLSPQGDPRRVARVYTPAEPVPLTALTAANKVLDGSARFRVFTHRDDHDRTLFVEATYRDTVLNANCRIAPLAGRGFYCPPETAGTLYADAACTQPLLNVPKSCSEPGEAFTVDSSLPVDALGFAREQDKECSALGRVVRRGAAYTASGPVYSKQSSTCMPMAPSGALYEYGADVPSEMVGVFPIVTE